MRKIIKLHRDCRLEVLLLVVTAVIVRDTVCTVNHQFILTLSVAVLPVHVPGRLALVMICISDQLYLPVVQHLLVDWMVISRPSRGLLTTACPMIVVVTRCMPAAVPTIEVFFLAATRHISQTVPLCFHFHDLLSR